MKAMHDRVPSVRVLLVLAAVAALSFGGSFDCRGSYGDDDDDPQVIVTTPKQVDD